MACYFQLFRTETLLISRKLNRPVHPPLFMENHQISEVDSHKHLGLYFSHDCPWHQHINHITVKAWARINIMRKLKFKLDRKSLETIYTAFIRPLIEYGDIIWDNCSRYEKDELEKFRMKRLELQQEPLDLFLLVLLVKKSDGSRSKRDEQIINLLCFIK